MSNEREALAADLHAHLQVVDQRGETKSCSCGVLFGVQHLENGSYGSHRLDALLAAGWTKAPTDD